MWENVQGSLKVLDDLSLLEQGIEKVVLIPRLINYVELSVNSQSQANYMEIICDFYTELLTDFYLYNSYKRNASSDQNLDTLASQQAKFNETIQAFSEITDEQTKTIFIKINNELRNLEYCLEYLMDSTKTHDQQFNKIMIQQSFRSHQTTANNSPTKFRKAEPQKVILNVCKLSGEENELTSKDNISPKVNVSGISSELSDSQKTPERKSASNSATNSAAKQNSGDFVDWSSYIRNNEGSKFLASSFKKKRTITSK